MTTALSEAPLRERKKARTLTSLLESADDLFAERGYDGTTLEDICGRAEVSVRTFFRYFESKSDLALHRERRNAAMLREGLAAVDAEGDTLAFLRDAYGGLCDELTNARPSVKRLRVMMKEPTLTAATLLIDLGIEDDIRAALLRQAGDDPMAELPARLLAAMIVGGHRSTLVQWMATGRKSDLPGASRAIVDFASESFSRWSYRSC